MHSVSKNIRAIRLARGLTQEELANRLFVTRQTVSNWETGKSQPDLDTLIQIADAIDTDATALIYGLPDSEARKREKKRFLITVGVLLILVGFLFLLAPKIEEMKRYYLFLPLFLLQMFYFPILYLLLGWTAIQGLELLGVLKPITSKYNKVIFLAAAAAVVLYFLLMLVYAAGRITFPIWFTMNLVKMVYRQPVLFVIPGLLLRLCRPKKKTE